MRAKGGPLSTDCRARESGSVSTDSEIQVESWSPDATVLGLVEAVAASLAAYDGVIVLPDRVEHEVGIYPDYEVPLVKLLRVAQIEARFLHAEASTRTFESHYGAEILPEIAVGILSNAAWAAIAGPIWTFITSRTAEGPVVVKIVRVRRTKRGTTIKGVRVTAPSGAEASAAFKGIAELLNGEGDE